MEATNTARLPAFICQDGTQLLATLRLSKRARHWHISLNNQGILELVFPTQQGKKLFAAVQRGQLDQLTQHLELNRAWIERAAKRTRSQRETYAQSKAAGLPTHLDFQAVGELWVVEYCPTEASGVSARIVEKRVSAQQAPSVLVLRLSGAVTDEALCRRALLRFTVRRAKELLPAFARRIARMVGAHPQSITVNNRKSAWGLCTRKGDIKIDRRVIFLPADMARQIVLHELAHLSQPNHSQRFYDTLYQLEGSSKEAEKAIKHGIQFVPAWFIDAAN